MENKFFSKFGNTLRRAFCGMLCLVIVLQCASISHGANIAESFQGYHWTRIESYSDLKNYKGKDSQNNEVKLIDGDKDRTKDTGWFKVLIGYTVDAKDYFFSGDSMCGDDGRECISALRVIEKYGIDFSKDEFDTRSGYYMPYIKYAGTDGDNYNDPKFFYRCSTTEDKPSENIIIGNISWYGVKHHACSYASFNKTSRTNPGTYKHGAACNSEATEAFTFQWKGDMLRLRVNVIGAEDRLWCYPYSNGVIDCKSGPSTNTSTFYLYIGYPTGSSAISGEYKAEAGVTTTLKNVALKSTGDITIEKNAYVVIDGSENIVNGDITVDGGILIIKGALDTAAETGGTVASQITVKNGGTLMIEDTGLLILRYQGCNLTVTGGSVMVVAGTCSVAGKIEISNSSFFAREGSALIHGAQVNEKVQAALVSKENLYTYGTGTSNGKGTYLSNFVNNFDPKTTAGDLEVKDKSVFEVKGIYYRGTYNDSKTDVAGNDIYVSYTAHTNVNSKIGDMVEQW